MRNELLAAVEYFKSLLQTIADDEWNREARNSATAALSALRDALRGPQPDPITGLVPCGCGGVAEQMDFHNSFFPHSKVECLECGIEITRVGYTIAEAHDMAKMGWNTSRGYAAPPRLGAIGPETGEMAPNGDEGK